MEKKRKPGRPTKFDPTYCVQVEKLCLLGATDEDMANFFEVTESTISLWKIEHPEFSEAIKNGKERADANVANRLYNRAMGYSHKAVKIFNDQGSPMVVDYIEHYPPDTAACIFWLKNRQRGKWRDKIDTEITGKDGEPIEHKHTVAFDDAASDLLSKVRGCG